jgi:heat shock protein HtpX
MADTRFIKDRGLNVRMGFVMAMLALLYLAVMAAIIVYFEASVVVVLVIAIAVAFAQWYFSDKIALAAMRAREVTPQEAPELHGMVDRLCALADMPKPRVAVADTDLPNAFATGRSPQHSVVCVTTGILRRLDAEELEGVLSHELSHVAHRDVAVMTIASVLGVVAGLITRWGLYFGGGRGRDRNSAAVFLVVWLASIVVYVISFLLTRALSRYRELCADRSGAFLTGKPSALASALVKISGDMARIPTQDLRKAEAMNAFFLVPALKGQALSSIIATHPPLEQRLEQLARVSAGVQRLPTGRRRLRLLPRGRRGVVRVDAERRPGTSRRGRRAGGRTQHRLLRLHLADLPRRRHLRPGDRPARGEPRARGRRLRSRSAVLARRVRRRLGTASRPGLPLQARHVLPVRPAARGAA